mmetsp:Transcript_33891/g.73366  ORF Transcript_33891/g.73366 Transcript_33891/m.73366 type:complete len:621 (+) Transcript_33891:190-2052(+)
MASARGGGASARGGLALVAYNAVSVALFAVALGMALEERSLFSKERLTLSLAVGTGGPGGGVRARYLNLLASKWLAPQLASALPHLLSSNANLLVLANTVACLLLTAACVLKALFFGALSVNELQRTLGRAVDYCLLKIVFIAAIGSSTTVEVFCWACWFACVGFVKLFSGLARDRFDSLLSTPVATAFDYGRNLAFVLALVGATGCLFGHLGLATRGEAAGRRVLLYFDPTVITLELMLTLLRSSMNLLERWRLNRVGHDDAGVDAGAAEATATATMAATTAAHHLMASYSSSANNFLYYAEFTFAMATHSLTLAHYCHVWYLHGFRLQVVDSIIMLNIRSLVGSMYSKFKLFAAFHCATSNLKRAFPDATAEELAKYNDVCAICKDSMAAGCGAKVLPCGHIFHLPCLRSWLEQGEHGNYTCPLCRFSLTKTVMKDPSSGDSSANGAGGPGDSDSSSLNVVDRVLQSINRRGQAVYDNLGRQVEGGFDRMVDYFFFDVLHLVPRPGAATNGGLAAAAAAAQGRQEAAVQGHQQQRQRRGMHHHMPHHPRPHHRHHRHHPLGGFFGGGGAARRAAAEEEIEGWTQIVSSILPHVPRHVIVRSLELTGDPNVTVNNLISF